MTIRKVVITDGKGDIPQDGYIVGVRYTAYKRTIRKNTDHQEVYDEEEVDSSVSFGSPDGALYVTLGSTSLLDELNEAIRTMRIGEMCDIFFARHDSINEHHTVTEASSTATSSSTAETSTIKNSPTRNTHMRFRIELLSAEKGGKVTSNSSKSTLSSSENSSATTTATTSTVRTITTPTKASSTLTPNSNDELPVFDFYNEALRHKESGNKSLIEGSKQTGLKSTSSIKDAIGAYRQGLACITEYERKSKQETHPVHTYEECQQLRVTIQSNMSQAYIKINQWKEAIEMSEKALAIEPQHPKSLFRLAFAYHQTQRYNECKELLEKLLIIVPDSEEAQRLLVKVKESTEGDGKENTKTEKETVTTGMDSIRSSSRSTIEKEPLLPATTTKSSSAQAPSSVARSSTTSLMKDEEDILRRAARKAFASSSNDKENGAGLYADTPTYNTPIIGLKEREKNLQDYQNSLNASSWFGWLTARATFCGCCSRRTKEKKKEV